MLRGPYRLIRCSTGASKGEFGMVISLYHDQGHIAAKMLNFYSTVSMNIGLPFLRTSVDHGTAFDIAGKNVANEVSMVQAIEKAIKYGNGYRKKFTEMEPLTLS